MLDYIFNPIFSKQPSNFLECSNGFLIPYTRIFACKHEILA